MLFELRLCNLKVQSDVIIGHASDNTCHASIANTHFLSNVKNVKLFEEILPVYLKNVNKHILITTVCNYNDSCH